VTNVCLDADWPEIANESQDNPPLLANPSSLAYIIYTSGSTGTPKGAMVTHGGVLNSLQWKQRRYELTEQDVFLMHTSLNFDPSVWEVFWPLMVGGRVVIAPAGMLESSALLSYMAEQSVTCAYFVPSQLGVLVEDPRLSEVRSLRYVISGGEKLPLGVMREFHELSKAELLHSYGPTETTVGSTEWACEVRAEKVLIGRPIGNTQAYVLDGQMEPLRVGVAGELYLGGAGVGRGYAGQAELTAERFVPDRFSRKAGARLYRTGDMVRYDDEGNLEFLGRVDQQVKLRGYRIELGEIEAVLRRHQQVREAVVVLRGEGEDQRLVAYVVSDVQAGELREYLKQQLPAYMVPSAFVLMDALPLTPNGKIDRRALPPDDQSTTSDSELTTPRDALELQLSQIWKEVLRREQIGLRDNFFDLGGHSLLAVRLVDKIERLLGEKIPLSILFQGATVEQLATTLRQRGKLSEQSLVRIQPDGSRPPLFLVHSASGNVMSYVALSRQLGTEQPVYGLQSRGLDPDRKPTTRVEDMASEYLQELTTVQPEGPYHLGGWSMGGVIAFEMARQLTAQGKSVAPLVLIDSVIHTGRVEENGIDDASLLLSLAQHHGLSLDDTDETFEDLRSLTFDEQLEYFLEKAASSDLIPRDIGLSQLRHLFELFKANVHAAESYRPAKSAQQVILFQATGALPDHAAERLRHWEQVAEVMKAHHLPGDHYSIVTEPNVTLLAEQIKSVLTA
jgi:amino acid adenylation domain-containing protein